MKKNTFIRPFWIFIIFLQFLFAKSDSELWSSIGFEKKIPRNFIFELEQGIRYKEQFSSFKQTFTELAISYEVTDGLSLFIPFRYAIFKEKIKQRLSVGWSFKSNFKPINFKYSGKFQKMYENSIFTDQLFRNKLTIGYNVNKKIKPYISGEIFYLNHENKYLQDENRFSLGISMKLFKKNRIKIFHKQKLEDLHKTKTNKVYVMGLAYSLEL